MGHWYSLIDGSPVYTVKKSSGKGERDTTLADARKLQLVPSVTTIFQLLAKPMLEAWKEEQLFKAIFSEPAQKNDEVPDDYAHRIRHKATEITRQSAKKGTVIHDSLEKYLYSNKMGLEHTVYIQAVENCLDENFPKEKIWIKEKSFSNMAGFGGKVDLHSKNVVLDFKTKDKEDLEGTLIYPEHLMQLAAYRIGLGVQNAECYNLFISTKIPGVVKLIKHDEKDLTRATEMFYNLLNYWKLFNNFRI